MELKCQKDYRVSFYLSLLIVPYGIEMIQKSAAYEDIRITFNRTLWN